MPCNNVKGEKPMADLNPEQRVQAIELLETLIQQKQQLLNGVDPLCEGYRQVTAQIDTAKAVIAYVQAAPEIVWKWKAKAFDAYNRAVVPDGDKNVYQATHEALVKAMAEAESLKQERDKFEAAMVHESNHSSQLEQELASLRVELRAMGLKLEELINAHLDVCNEINALREEGR